MNNMVDFETKSISVIEIDTAKAKKYIKEHTNQPIGDIPLWVLVSMGAWALTLEEMKEVLDKEDSNG